MFILKRHYSMRNVCFMIAFPLARSIGVHLAHLGVLLLQDLAVRQDALKLKSEIIMAIYEYECCQCGEKFELRRMMSEKDEDVTCPRCKTKSPDGCFRYSVARSRRLLWTVGGGGGVVAEESGKAETVVSHSLTVTKRRAEGRVNRLSFPHQESILYQSRRRGDSRSVLRWLIPYRYRHIACEDEV